MQLFKFIVAFLITIAMLGCNDDTSIGPDENEESESAEYKLSITSSPTNGGSVDPSSETFEEAKEITVEATANEGWKFVEWTGDKESIDNPFSFKIENDVELTANFTETGATEYQLTVTANPTDGGSVNPADSTVTEGEDVEITATPNEGWEFSEWTGDQQSTDNPLTFTINQDTDLTANFQDTRSEYNITLTVSDSLDSMELELGQKGGATSGFDSGTDAEAPPPPPQGTLHAYLRHDGTDYFEDFRGSISKQLDWNLEYQIGSGDTLKVSWQIDEVKLNGSLKLTDNGESFSVDMQQETSYEYRISEHDELYIKYRFVE